LTVSRSRALTGRNTASELISRPTGTTTDRRPPNATGRSEPGRTAAPSPDRPIEAPASRSGALPNTFDTRIRTPGPPRLTRIGWRSVWLSNPSDQLGMKKSGTGATSEVAQLAVHRPPPAPEESDACAGAALTTVAMTSAASRAEAVRKTRGRLILPI
jgi:hypothetical protein